MPNYQEPSKLKKGYQAFRRTENKVGVFVFLLMMLAMLVAGLLCFTPDAPDRLWFITMVVLFVTGIATVIGTWSQRVNKRNKAKQDNYTDKREQ